mgnify:CR=1 FL=1
MRISRDDLYLQMAALLAKRTTCVRRGVGCVLVDPDGYVLATGYNGVAAGMPHCNAVIHTLQSGHHHPHACPAAFAASGTQLDGCEAIHAEQNAIMRVGDIRKIHTCYTTVSPCMTCTKLLLGTACQRIVFAVEYPHAQSARELWQRAGRTWG